jgi:hypothetical protein
MGTSSSDATRINPGNSAAVQRVIDSAPLGLEFLKFETAVFSRFAFVPGVEAAFAATHYDEKIGMFRCLTGDDPICCSKYGAARPTIVALAWHYLNASRTDGLMPENEPVLLAAKVLRLSATNLETMQAAAADKTVTLYDVDWRGLKVADKKPLIIQVVSLNPRWKVVEEDAQRLAKPYLDGKALDQALGKRINRADVVAAIANSGSGVAPAAEQPPVEVLD